MTAVAPRYMDGRRALPRVRPVGGHRWWQGYAGTDDDGTTSYGLCCGPVRAARHRSKKAALDCARVLVDRYARA